MQRITDVPLALKKILLLARLNEGPFKKEKIKMKA
jgi:hypothetical protein